MVDVHMDDEETFILTESCLQELLNELKVEQTNIAKQMLAVPLSADDAVKKPFYDGFTCKICMNVVYNPRQCGKCENLFCNDCIQRWMEA